MTEVAAPVLPNGAANEEDHDVGEAKPSESQQPVTQEKESPAIESKIAPEKTATPEKPALVS